MAAQPNLGRASHSPLVPSGKRLALGLSRGAEVLNRTCEERERQLGSCVPPQGRKEGHGADCPQAEAFRSLAGGDEMVFRPFLKRSDRASRDSPVGHGSNTTVMAIKAPLPQRAPGTLGGLPWGYPHLSTLSSLQKVSVLFKSSIRGSTGGKGKDSHLKSYPSLPLTTHPPLEGQGALPRQFLRGTGRADLGVS